MGYQTPVQSVKISDPAAVRLINDRAAKESRTAANAAAVTIVEALSARANDTDAESVGQVRNTR